MLQRRRAAFTLLEILAVVIIIGLVAGLVLPNVGITRSRRVDDEAQRLAADLEFARQRSVMTSAPHRVVLDLDAGAWWIEWAPSEDAQVPAQDDAEARDDDAPIGPTGTTAIDLSPPRRASGEFQPLPAGLARAWRLSDGVAFARVTTPGGEALEGSVSIAFERDGSAEPTEIALAGEGGYVLVLELRSLADAVWVRRDA